MTGSLMAATRALYCCADTHVADAAALGSGEAGGEGGFSALISPFADETPLSEPNVRATPRPVGPKEPQEPVRLQGPSRSSKAAASSVAPSCPAPTCVTARPDRPWSKAMTRPSTLSPAAGLRRRVSKGGIGSMTPRPSGCGTSTSFGTNATSRSEPHGSGCRTDGSSRSGPTGLASSPASRCCSRC